MHWIFVYEIDVYPKKGSPKQTEKARLGAEGSTPSRARRRILNAVHSRDYFVRGMQLVEQLDPPGVK